MFCKRTYCALILMMEAALAYSSDRCIDVDFVSQKHTISPKAFDGIIERLSGSKLVEMVNGKLHLTTAPDKITVLQIINSVTSDDMFTRHYFSEENPAFPTSSIIMLHKERETLFKVVENRLARQKLSVWSERASKTIYI